MNKILKNILVIFITIFLIICTNKVKAQNHVIGSNEKYKSTIIAYNYSYFKKDGYRQNLSYIESIDSINVNSSSILSGDSIVMLIGDVPAVITYAIIKVDTGSSYTPYVTSGTTDTTLIYSRYYTSNVPIAMIADTTYKTQYGGYTGVPVSTNFTESDSCLFYLKIPESKYTNGTSSYTVIYKYMKL
jgi:hypothetical protein